MWDYIIDIIYIYNMHYKYVPVTHHITKIFKHNMIRSKQEKHIDLSNLQTRRFSCRLSCSWSTNKNTSHRHLPTSRIPNPYFDQPLLVIVSLCTSLIKISTSLLFISLKTWGDPSFSLNWSVLILWIRAVPRWEDHCLEWQLKSDLAMWCKQQQGDLSVKHGGTSTKPSWTYHES